MRKALRPYLTAGVAVVGAGALAIAPVIATPPDVRIVNPAVHQSGGAFDSYVETVREALENLEALLGSALALPAPTDWTLKLALDNLFSDPNGNVALFVDELEALGPLAGTSVPAMLQSAADSIGAAVQHAADGSLDLAIVSLIRAYAALAPAVTAIVVAPLELLGPDVGDAATVVLAKSLTAAAGPVLSGIGSTAVAIQDVVDALDDAKPGSGALFRALVAAPATVLDGVLNGFTIAPGSTALPGLLTPGDPFDPTRPDPGPVALAWGLATGSAPSPPHAPGLTDVSALPTHRTVSLTADDLAMPPAEEYEDADLNESLDPEMSTNTNVMAEDAGVGSPDTTKHRPPVFGGSAGNRTAGTGLTTLRQGIRDGIRELRDGVRDAVKTVTGHDRSAAGDSPAAGDESAGA